VATETHEITVSGLRIAVVRKNIKNLHLGVYPPQGRVRIAAPLGVSNEAIRLAVVDRLAWIKRQRSKFEAQPRQTTRRFVSGETHFYLGKRYRLNLSEGARTGSVRVRNSRAIDLSVQAGSNQSTRERVLHKWYREQLRSCAGPLIEKWAASMDLPMPEWGIKRMKTKWGSCNIEARRIWINLELIKKPPQCLEYIIVHELMHFFERRHSDRFVELMDKALPHWRTVRDELNAEPLAHESW
jgi:predicted metal-dependent hydrolase